MSLYKPGKEHTINFIYCCAALHPYPSRHSAPYSQRLGTVSLDPDSLNCHLALGSSIPVPRKTPRVWSGCFRPFLSVAALRVLYTDWHFIGGKARACATSPLWVETGIYPHPPTPTSQARQTWGEGKVTGHSLDCSGLVCFPPSFILTLDFGDREASFQAKSWLPAIPTSPWAYLSYHHQHSQNILKLACVCFEPFCCIFPPTASPVQSLLFKLNSEATFPDEDHTMMRISFLSLLTHARMLSIVKHHLSPQEEGRWLVSWISAQTLPFAFRVGEVQRIWLSPGTTVWP